MGVRGNSQCCTSRQDEVSVPSPVTRPYDESSSSSSASLEEIKYDWYFPYIIQSEAVIIDDTKHQADVDSKVNVKFLENNMTDISEIPTISYLKPKTDFTAIQKFFSRPVRIQTKVWNESDTIGSTGSITPWGLWASNTAVANKLNNYAFFRGDLHLKFQLSASPFYYGMMQASYLPLQSFKPGTIISDASNNYLIPQSQRPRIEIDPSIGDTFEMVLPFIYNYNMINVSSLSDLNNLGIIYYDIYSPLQSANGVSGSGITISVYAWVDDISLVGASAGYSVQSDEYGEGPISRPASWLSSFASNFTGIPLIGPFATATQIGASAVSSIASIFGFTNVPVIEDTKPMRSEPFPKLATSEIGFPVEKLTLDPKNELSIDPRIIGLSTGEDELAIGNLVQRPSYLCRSNWSTSDLVDTIKFSTRITPVMSATTLSGTQTMIFATPMAYFANLFKYWRGDIILTIKVICSKYHKGKLRISYDPNGVNASGQNIIVSSDTMNTVATTILDIGEANMCELRIPYQQNKQFMNLDTINTVAWSTSSSPTFTRDNQTDNGTLTIRVQNVLTAPVSSSSVDILIYARGAENLEYACPDNVDSTNLFSFYQPQSEEYNLVNTTNNVVLGEAKSDVSSQYMTHFGENIKSLRQLLRRYSKHETLLLGNGSVPANNYSYWLCRFMRLPTSPGYQTGGLSTANKIVGTGTSSYNYVHFVPLAWVSNAFLCYRGSVNRTFNIFGSTNSGAIRCFRNSNGMPTSITNSRVDNAATTNSTISRSALVASGSVGQSLTDQRTQAGVNVQFPMFTNSIFQSTDPARTISGSSVDGSDRDVLVVTVDEFYPSTVSTNQLLNSYVAAGTDFSLHFFLNAPVVWLQSSLPAAV